MANENGFCDALTDATIRAQAGELVRLHGPNKAARALGVTRGTALSLAAGARVSPATFALIRERAQKVNAKSETETADNVAGNDSIGSKRSIEKDD